MPEPRPNNTRIAQQRHETPKCTTTHVARCPHTARHMLELVRICKLVLHYMSFGKCALIGCTVFGSNVRCAPAHHDGLKTRGGSGHLHRETKGFGLSAHTCTRTIMQDTAGRVCKVRYATIGTVGRTAFNAAPRTTLLRAALAPCIVNASELIRVKKTRAGARMSWEF